MFRSASTLHSAVGTSIAAVVCVVLAVVAASSRGLWITLAAICAVMGWRAWVVGIRIDPDGVKVTGFLLSRRVRWQEIDHFAVLPLGGWPWVGHVVLRDGRQLGTYGLGAPGRPRLEAYRLQVQKPIDELNAVLTQWQEQDDPQQPRSEAR